MRLEDRAIKEAVERVMTVPSGNLHIEVVDDEIFVTESSFYAAYCKPANQSHLVLRRRTQRPTTMSCWLGGFCSMILTPKTRLKRCDKPTPET
jgi:hypothetical protein